VRSRPLIIWSSGHLVIWLLVIWSFVNWSSVMLAGAEARAQKPASAARSQGIKAAPKVEAAPPGDVTVRASLDRTALWVADRLTYTIEVTCRKGFDILEEDLGRDKLKLDGLDVLGSDSSTEVSADDTTVHRYQYYLTTYRVDVPTLKIAPIVVRYYVKRPGERLEDVAPAGEAEAPAAVVAFRSTLPDGQDSYDLRDRRPAAPRPPLFAMLQPVAIGLMAASIVPTAFWLLALAARRRTSTPRKSARQLVNEERARLEAARAIDIRTVDGRREAYTQLNGIVRDHVKDVCGIPAPSLTSAEIESVLSAHARRMPVEIVRSLLAQCETARYAPEHARPSEEACRAAFDETEQLLAAE
jgi:hypothetical protein